MTLLGQKIALNPNKEQVAVFNQCVHFARSAYNAAHSDWNADRRRSLYDLKKIFNSRKRDVFPEFAELSQNVGKNAIHAFGDAITRYKSGQNEAPKRKTHKSRPAFQIDNGVNSVRITEDGKHVILPKIGRVRLHEPPRWTGEIRRAFVKRIAHRWYLSILVNVDEPEPPDTSGIYPASGENASHLPARGCDVGISTLAKTIDEHGEVQEFENPRALRVNERKLRRANKALARKTFRSKNWWKAKEFLARVHHRISNVRMNAHHQATHRILQGISALGIESLTVKGLMKNRKLSKALADASLSGFLTKLKYKAVRRGIRIVEADRFWPSTKRCSSCGYVKKTVTLSEREYHCGVCGFVADRDINAAINLRQLASSTEESLNACSAKADGASVPRDAVRPTQVGWHRNPRERGRSRKMKPNQIAINFATA